MALLLGGCATVRSATAPPIVVAEENEPQTEGEWDREPPVSAAEAETDDGEDEAPHEWPDFLREFSPGLSPSLLGALTAHVPGRDRPKASVSLGRVHVGAKIEGGFAYTEVEEELLNEGDRPTEVIASFRAPLGGVIARMALLVDERWVEAEIVERKQAAEVYEGIVRRSYDPALLEQDPSGAVKLRVFPVPAHGSRRVVVGYVQPLERREGRYRFDLGLRPDEASAPIHELVADVDLVGVDGVELALPDRGQPAATIDANAAGTKVRWEGAQIRPADVRLSFPAPLDAVTTFVPAKAKGAERFVALHVVPDLPAEVPPRDVSVWLIDTSAGQRGAALDVSKAIARELLKQLPAGHRFAVLACDTACTSYPRRGLATATTDSRSRARRFIRGLEARGASDLGYALLEASQRAQDQGHSQLVYFGDARPTAGDLDVKQIVDRLVARDERLDVRLIGLGSGVDADSLSDLAGHIAAARTTAGEDSRDAARIARWLSQPILRAPSLQLPSSFESAYPQKLPNLVQGDELLVLARLGRAQAGALRGQLSGTFDHGANAEAWQSRLGLELPARALQADSVPRLWAHARLRDLDDDDAPQAYFESVELSKRYQVLSRHTSFLALESDAMFHDYGIEQRMGRADFGREPVVMPTLRRIVGKTRTHVTRIPRIRMAVTTVSGHVPPQTIQATVRLNAGRFRACYQDGLLRNPKLEGTVKTRFVIARDGTVAVSMDGGSTLADPAVVACIVSAFKMLVFPAPDDGIITVVYPLTLSPDTGEQAGTPKVKSTHSEEPPLATLAPNPQPVAALAPAPQPAPPSEPAPHVSATELAVEVEQDPTNVELQLAAAQAYEAEHDERRACAHFRAAATLAPQDIEAQYQALRCRARVLKERVSVLADVARLELHSAAIDALVGRIRTLAEIPAYSPAPGNRRLR